MNTPTEEFELMMRAVDNAERNIPLILVHLPDGKLMKPHFENAFREIRKVTFETANMDALNSIISALHGATVMANEFVGRGLINSATHCFVLLMVFLFPEMGDLQGEGGLRELLMMDTGKGKFVNFTHS